MSVPNVGYARKASWSLNYISTFLLKQFVSYAVTRIPIGGMID